MGDSGRVQMKNRAEDGRTATTSTTLGVALIDRSLTRTSQDSPIQVCECVRFCILSQFVTLCLLRP